MKKLVVSFMLLLSLNAFSKEIVLSTTDNDDNNEVYKLIVKADDQTDTLLELFKDTYINGKKIKRDKLNPDELKTKNGVILERRDKYNVLNLKSDNFDFERGGQVTIDTLLNGVNGERKFYHLDLAKDKTGWKLFKDGRVVSRFHVKVNSIIIIGTVGIKTIVME